MAAAESPNADGAVAGLLFALTLDGRGGASTVGWLDAERWSPDNPPLWLYLDRTAPGIQAWLRGRSDLHPVAAGALLEEETRPRCAMIGGGLLLILRGVNLNPGAQDDELISVRLWTDGRRIVSLRRVPLASERDVRALLEAGKGPMSCHGVMVALAEQLGLRMQDTLQALTDGVDDLERQMIDTQARLDLRRRLGVIRRRAIRYKRHLAPQREALSSLAVLAADRFDEEVALKLREAQNRFQRYVEELEEVREHAAVVQDELTHLREERLNRNMYLLTIVAAIMLPLTVVTGLLGANVGGIPGGESEWGFAWVVGVLTGLVAAQIAAFRLWRLM